jgi:hypothetical protein
VNGDQFQLVTVKGSERISTTLTMLKILGQTRLPSKWPKVPRSLLGGLAGLVLGNALSFGDHSTHSCFPSQELSDIGNEISEDVSA